MQEIYVYEDVTAEIKDVLDLMDAIDAGAYTDTLEEAKEQIHELKIDYPENNYSIIKVSLEEIPYTYLG